MGYSDVLKIAKQIKIEHRLPLYARFYKSLNLNGMHYVYQIGETNNIFLCRPNHSTHPEVTAFLFNEYYKKGKINTVEGHAKNLKKFLDFLMFWNLEEELPKIHEIRGEPYPLFVILEAFSDYLRLIPKGERMEHAVEWSLLTEVPLHELASSFGKVVQLDFDAWDNLRIVDWCQFEPGALNPIIATACYYLRFLANRTNRFKTLPMVQIPVKFIRRGGIHEGTTGKALVEVFDTEAITKDSVIFGPGSHRKINPIELNEVCSLEDADAFFGILDPVKDAQNKLIFTMLRYFGIRPGEGALIKIDPSSIPNLKNYPQSIKTLKSSLKGDLKCLYDKSKGVFQGWYVDTGWKTKASDRSVPLLSHRAIDTETGEVQRFPTTEEFTTMLYWALVQREIAMRHQGQDHGYLFVSLSRATLGQPINEDSVYSKFMYIAKKLLKSTSATERPINLKEYHPHTFRHLFATVLLVIYKVPLQEISSYLGHSSSEITRRTYIHWILTKNLDDEEHGTVSDMVKTFVKQDGKSVKK